MPVAEASSQTAVEGSPYGRHIPALDGLRAVAIVGVMASHLFPGNPAGPASRAVAAVFSAGANGVDLFFVLSGFLITGILFDSLGDEEFFRKFYARRVLRIFPLYYAVLLLFLVISFVQNVPDKRELLSLGLYLQNTGWVAPPIWAFQPATALPLNHFWSLAVEEQFYLVWPLLVWAVMKRRPLLWMCLLAGVVCPVLRLVLELHGWGYQEIHTNTLCRADALLAGGALSLGLRSRFHDRVLRGALWMFVAVIPIALLQFGWVPRGGVVGAVVGAVWPTLLLLLFVAMLGLTLVPGAWARVCSLGWMRWLGKYSYGLYVFHPIVGHFVEAPVRGLLGHVLHSKMMVAGAAGLVVAGISAVVAWASYQLFEKRFLRLKKYFEYRKTEIARA